MGEASVLFPPPPVITPDVMAESIKAWVYNATMSTLNAHNEASAVLYSGEHAEEDKAALMKLLHDVKDVVWDDIDATFDKIRALVPNLPFDMSAWVLTHMMGLTITGDQIKNLFLNNRLAENRRALGKTLTTLYDQTLTTDDVAAGYLKREPGEAERGNFEELAGAAMRLQLADMMLRWLAKKIPAGLGSFFEKMADLFNDAVALDDALEEVVQVPMEAVITNGWLAMYNRKIKPVDFTASEALQARIAGVIDEPTLAKILDNLGYRLDIREQMRNSAATNLSESDINDLYQHNVFDREQVKEQYKWKYYEEGDRELKTLLVEKTRRWKLEEKIFELYGNLYRDGVATKEEVRPFLEHFGYDPDEIDMWFSVQELERKQRKWLPIGKVNTLAKTGKWTVQQAVDYLVLQGMTPEDAANDLNLDDTALSRNDIIRLVGNGSMLAQDGLTRMTLLGYNQADAGLILSDAILEDALRQIPKKIRDECLGEHYERAQLTAALTVATTLNPEVLYRNSHFVTEAQCILEHYATTTPEEPPPPPPLAGPAALVVTPAAGENRLSWQPVSGALYYTVSRKDNPWGVFIALSPPTFETSMVDKGVVHGTWYYYRVTGNVNDVETEPSNEVLAVGV